MSYQLRPPQPSPSQQEAGYDTYGSSNSYGQNPEYGFSYSQHAYTQGQIHAQPPRQQQYQPDMTHAQSQPPSPLPAPPATIHYPQDGIARTQTWIVNQPPVLPPPPPAKTPFSEWAGHTDSTFDRRTLYSPSMPPRPRKEEPRIYGIKRNTFFIVVAISAFLLVVAAAVGLGVGLGTRRDVGLSAGSAAANGGAAGSSPTSTIPTSTTTTTTRTSPTPIFTGASVPGPVFCPQNNNTVYIAQGSSKPFNIQCGRDYSSQNGALDIVHIQKPTMSSCIDACGKRDDCVGVGWGTYQSSPQCWMKSKLGEPNWSPLWYFAQLQHMPNNATA
ncbi:uncharacterized protein GGS22DRAFT_190179 [Annulohypoxylon maeteangense]|uniref:uncharacterized protein n=1 Tax=Annulohypoxylon maeteangense TaxID=1927788 RepID=UPI0020081F3E|nr:uncharacterized protein GGS22DRAFT_190179 [Annulohypoxylon maeteangense]KAI0883520.1 hypothetical protein GGS22DRAFT_190179 [Annulohypoxylon maeteangense]